VTQGRWKTPRSTTTEALAEDFLYHLYRGSEFLASGRFDGARDELELALKMQPRDAAAQDLLAKLYFRLGVYPRAIELYQDIVRQFPERVAPRINLALAYLKTGQMRDVVMHLLPVIEREPGHTRAWGYLGLAWSRLGEYAKAREAFARAGHEGMARRMEEALEPRAAPAPAPSIAPPAGAAGEGSAATVQHAIDEIDTSALEPGELTVAEPSTAPSPGRWTTREPGGEAAPMRDDGAVALGEFVQRRGLAPRGGALELDDGALVVVGGCAARIDARCVGSGLALGEELSRRGAQAGPFAGEPRLVWLREGWTAIPARPGVARAVLVLRDEALSVREDALAAFEGTLQYENVVLAGAIVAAVLRGRGRLALEAPGALRTLAVSAERPLTLPPDALVAWSPALVVATANGAASLALRGEGIAVVALGGRRQEGPGHG
jgi:tetratricopeptide (TPR) repeat protein